VFATISSSFTTLFNRTKERPYFGCTVAGTSKEDQVRWIGALLAGEHPQSLLPSPVLLQ